MSIRGHPKSWNSEDEALLRDMSLSDRMLSKILQVSRMAVQHHRLKIGVKKLHSEKVIRVSNKNLALKIIARMATKVSSERGSN